MTYIIYAAILFLTVANVYGCYLTLKSKHEMLKTLLVLVEIVNSPKFTCYYCNNPFPRSQEQRIGNYSYCEEHANREPLNG